MASAIAPGNRTEEPDLQEMLLALGGAAEHGRRGPIDYDDAVSILQNMALAAQANQTNFPASSLASLVMEREVSRAQKADAPRDRSELWRADRRYRALVEHIPVVTFMAGLDETVHELYVSPQIETLLGFTQKEWLENPFLWFNQLHPDDRERWQREFALTCTTGVRFRAEYRFLARDGHVVWVHGECQLIRDDQGQPLFLQGIAYDITETKRAEESLLRMHRDLELLVQNRTQELATANLALRSEIAERERAQQALAAQATELARSNAELSQFAYVASHDLQEPLRMMSGFSQLLAERYRGRLDRDADEFIHFITDGAARMHRLIEDLLLYSRVGRRDLDVGPVDCRMVLESACTNLRTAIAESHARITPEGLPIVTGNETQLVQLFQNLVGNAIKFRSPGRRLEIHVSAERQGIEWLFSVRDNGFGFAQEYAERIFLIFQRLHSKVEYPGTGMGLAICRKIVERHGGRIWAHSVPGEGSTFHFTLPAAEVSDE